MRNDPLSHPLREVSWRRKLTPAEQAELAAWLVSHPEAQADWDAENRLSEVLSRLPDAPVPSNFTARVLQAVEHETTELARNRSKNHLPWWRRVPWISRATGGLAIIAALAVVIQHQHRETLRRTEFANRARAISAVSGVASLPSPESLLDFDVIYVLNPPPGPDEKLLTLLQ